MNAVAIDQLSSEEKLLLLEALWDSLSTPAAQFETPAWHRDVLEDRLRRLADDSESVCDWHEAKERIRRLARMA